jgi:hypothetical protein
VLGHVALQGEHADDGLHAFLQIRRSLKPRPGQPQGRGILVFQRRNARRSSLASGLLWHHRGYLPPVLT